MQTLSPMLFHLATLTTVAAGSLVSAVWKGAVIAACVALCLRLLPGVGASARSLVWMVVFLMLVVLPFASGFHAEGGLGQAARLHFDVRWAWALAGVWAVLAVVRLVQLVRSAVHLRGISKRARGIDLPAELDGLFEDAEKAVAGPKSVPQRLKPNCNGSIYGTAEAVPLQGFANPASASAGRDFMSGLQPLDQGGLVTQGVALGWDMAAPLALNVESLTKTRPFQQGLFGRRVVRVCMSDEVSVPSVVGFFRPLILLPPGLLASVSAADLRQILLHEMEHLRRGDDWTNLLQKVSLVLFPVNPVLLWVERRLCVERELACDDGVLRATGARKAYATCLANLAEQSLIRRGALLALGAWERQSELARRVTRILRTPVGEMGRVQTAAMVAVMLAGTTGGVLALARTPQLVSFNNGPAVETAAIGVPNLAVAPPVLRMPEAAHAELVKAVMPPRRVAVSVQAAKQARVSRIPNAVEARQVQRGQSEETLIGWRRDAAGSYRPVAVTFAQDSQFTYAAIAVPDGWLIVQL